MSCNTRNIGGEDARIYARGFKETEKKGKTENERERERRENASFPLLSCSFKNVPECRRFEIVIKDEEFSNKNSERGFPSCTCVLLETRSASLHVYRLSLMLTIN